MNVHTAIMKETNKTLIDVDPYCCKTSIKTVNRSPNIKVGQIPREKLTFVFYFEHEGYVDGNVARITPRLLS